ncbi:CD209 antigen-like, partial [Scomber scombrus]
MTTKTRETTFSSHTNPNVYQHAEGIEEEDIYVNAEYNTGDKTPATSVTSVISTKLSNEIKSSDQANRHLSAVIKAKENFSSLTDQLKAENQQLKEENQQVKEENQQVKEENQQ